MRKHTLSDVFLALTIGGCMAVLSPQQDSNANGTVESHAGTVPTLTAAANGTSATRCQDSTNRVGLPNPATIAGEAASNLEMPFFSFGSAHLE